MKTDAVVNFAPEPYSVALREVEVRPPGEGEVMLEVSAVGICGSDLHQWTSQHSWPVAYPVTLGHEFTGVIREVGKGVNGWEPGVRVVSETAAVIDEASPLTRAALYNLDPTRKGFGYGVDGAMARYVVVPERCLHRVPQGLPDNLAALTEPCCVAYNAVIRNNRVEPGDRIVVLGPGPIGLLCARVAQLAGAEVAVAGLVRDDTRLGIARSMNMPTFFTDRDSGRELTQWCLERDGLGADGVVDAAGVSATLDTALQLVRPAGFISKVGWGPQPLGFSLDRMVLKNVRIQGSFSHNWTVWERVLALLASGALDIRQILGGVWPLAQWEQAFHAMHDGRVVKAVLRPGH